jgi:hypothetical protein
VPQEPLAARRGTTAKAGVISESKPLTTGSALIGGYEKALPIQIPMMDIFEVGTGGGSIDAALVIGKWVYPTSDTLACAPRASPRSGAIHVCACGGSSRGCAEQQARA